MSTNSTRDTLFIQLSERLTGIAPLPAGLASDYLARLEGMKLQGSMDEMLGRFSGLLESGEVTDDALSRDILEVPELRTAAQQVIVLWYSSALMEKVDDEQPVLVFGRPEHHFQAALWSAIGAHPPALSGGYFGHWHYPPET
jgi:hypothetical protein